MAQRRRTLRDVIGIRDRSAFVGRQAQLALFQSNLAYDSRDERRRWIFDVHGPPGVGKTFLVKQWARIAHEFGAVHAYLTDTVEDLPDAMAIIAAAFAQQKAQLRRFEDRHRVYLQRRRELQSDPAAPPEAASL